MGMLDNLIASFRNQPPAAPPMDIGSMIGAGYEGSIPESAANAPANPFGMLNDQMARKRAMAWGPFPSRAGGPGEFNVLPPSTNDPLAREPVAFKDGVPLPRPRPQPPGEPLSLSPPVDEAALPAAAQPTQGQGAPEAVNPLKAWADRTFTPANAPTMMALASGFAGAPSFGTGMRRAASAATPAIALKQSQDVKQGMIASTYRALVARGVKPADALVAAMNPEVLKAGSESWLGLRQPKVVDVGSGMMGPTKGIQNPDGTISPITMAPPPNAPRVSTFEEALRLPKGTVFYDPQGIPRTR